MKRIGLFSCLLLALAIFSFKAKVENALEDTSAVILKLRYKSSGMSGYGGTLKLRNIETNVTYEGESKFGLNPFVVILNVPNGTYIVEELQVITGYNTLAIRYQSFFTSIKIDTPKIYYLGNYKIKKVAPLSGMNFKVSKENNDDEKKIYKQLGKYADFWLKYKICFDYSLFKSENTNIDFSIQR